MNKVRNVLVQAAQKLDLPSDLVAMTPRAELLGTQEWSLEPHKGLMEYTPEKITIDSSLGRYHLTGRGMTIKQMNSQRITITGQIATVLLPEDKNE